jgi:hypothetical protein
MQSRLFRLAWPLTALFMVATLPWFPERVGDPGHEGSRVAYLVSMLLSVATCGLLSPGFVVWLGRKAPQQISLPHRAYWLAPERREATLACLGRQVCAVGLMMLLLLGGIHGFMLLRSRPDWPQPPMEVWLASCAALSLWFAVWCWQTWRLFPAPPREEHEPQWSPRRPREHR